MRYLFELLKYWLATSVFYIARVFTYVPIISGFSKEIVVSYAVGFSAKSISDKRYKHAYKVLKTIEDYELNDSWMGSALYNLGVLYYYGYGVERDKSKAIDIFKKALEAGNTDAIDFLKRSENDAAEQP